MLREMPRRMFSSLTERLNVLRELKQTPDVSTGFRPPCWSPSDGLQHGVSILTTIIFSHIFCRITRVWNLAHARNFGTLFIYYSSTICQFLDSICGMVSDFVFTCVIIKLTCVTLKPRIAVDTCYWEVFVLKQISKRTKKVVGVTSTTGCTANVFKHKAGTTYSFSGINASHEPRIIC